MLCLIPVCEPGRFAQVPRRCRARYGNGSLGGSRWTFKLGELVQVRSPGRDRGRRLTTRGRNRGLSFDRATLRYCGRTLRVQDRVKRIIDERTGQMIDIFSDCSILDGSVRSGECSTNRWFCPREIYQYWREAWLQRVDDSEPAASANGRGAGSAPSFGHLRYRHTAEG